jgi:putative PIN family toxin of toxin-antitoxin system
MKVLLDTNIFLSGLISPDGVPGQIVQAWREAKFEIVLSEYVLEEIGRVLCYPKIKSRLKWDQKKIEQFLFLLKMKSVLIEPLGIEANVSRDKKDNPILSCFLASKADYLVTGDKDILSLSNQYPAIIKPAVFFSKF